MPACLYCHAPIEGVEVLEYEGAALEAYLDIGVLYVHKMCHKERIPVDPDALWKMLVESLQDLKKWPDNPDTRRHAIDCLTVLATWLHMGGFPPTLTRENEQK